MQRTGWLNRSLCRAAIGLRKSWIVEGADKTAEESLTRCYESTECAQQTGHQRIRTLRLLLQRPPLAMFDPSLIHRNDEIFNPEPNRLGIFFGAPSMGALLRVRVPP